MVRTRALGGVSLLALCAAVLGGCGSSTPAATPSARLGRCGFDDGHRFPGRRPADLTGPAARRDAAGSAGARPHRRLWNL